MLVLAPPTAGSGCPLAEDIATTVNKAVRSRAVWTTITESTETSLIRARDTMTPTRARNSACVAILKCRDGEPMGSVVWLLPKASKARNIIHIRTLPAVMSIRTILLCVIRAIVTTHGRTVGICGSACRFRATDPRTKWGPAWFARSGRFETLPNEAFTGLRLARKLVATCDSCAICTWRARCSLATTVERTGFLDSGAMMLRNDDDYESKGWIDIELIKVLK